MGAILTMFMVISVSFIVTRIASMALVLTGLSSESAKFQARSAFTGCGFTTNEAESIVNHPVRRRIVMLLMLAGNFGVATIIATVLVSLLGAKETAQQQDKIALLINATILVSGVVLLYILVTSAWVEKKMNVVIAWGLKRWTKLEVQDYISILQLQNGYAVSEMKITDDDWLAGKSLKDSGLTKEGVLVLGIQKTNQSYIGAPNALSKIDAGDTLVLYAPTNHLAELDQRCKGHEGERAHFKAVESHTMFIKEQTQLEMKSIVTDKK